MADSNVDNQGTFYWIKPVSENLVELFKQYNETISPREALSVIQAEKGITIEVDDLTAEDYVFLLNEQGDEETLPVAIIVFDDIDTEELLEEISDALDCEVRLAA